MKTRAVSEEGFTLLEVLIIFAVVGMLAAISFKTTDMIGDALRDRQAQQAEAFVVGAQQTRYETFGSYASTPTAVGNLLNGLTVVEGSSPSTGPSVVSTTDGTVDGVYVVAAAVSSDTGSCFIWRAAPPTDTAEDVRLAFKAGEFSECTAAFALTADGGKRW